MTARSPHIVLIGPMGVGKSTIGRQLAAVLDREFLDSDAMIEAEYGRTASVIADADGVAKLHDIELEVFQRMADRMEPSVIAPAASVVDSDIGCRLIANATGINLVADSATLARRRELLGHRRIIDEGEAARLRRNREEALASCTRWTIDTDGTVEATLASIVEVLDRGQ